MVDSVPLFSFLDGGGQSLGNVIDGNWVISVEVHHVFSGIGGDGLRRSCGGPYGGQRAKGCLDQSINGDGRHGLGSVGVVVRTGVVFTEVGVDEDVARWLIVESEEKELLGLKAGLELKVNLLERDSVDEERLWFGCNCSGESAHLAMVVVVRAFIAGWGCL
jgi:hypothetical protein